VIVLAEPLVAPLVLLDRGVPVPGLEEADQELRQVRPVASRCLLLAPQCRSGAAAQPVRAAVLEVVSKIPVTIDNCRLWDISRQKIVQRRNIGRALDAAMTSHRLDSAARPSHVAEQ